MVRPEAVAASVAVVPAEDESTAQTAQIAEDMKEIKRTQMKQQRELGLIYLLVGAFMFVSMWRRGQLPPWLQMRINSWFGKVVRWDGGGL